MASTYLSFTPSSTGNQRTFTFSFWVKRSKLGLGGTGQVIYCQSYGSDGYQFKIEFTSNDEFRLYNSKGASDAINLKTSKLFRDTSSWYAITIQIDTTQSTESDRAKIYVNGVQETAFGTSTYPTQNLELDVNAAAAQIIGAKYSGSYSTYFDGLLAQFIFVDGTAYAASTFGSTNSTSGEWKANANPTVSYGSNGYILTFEDTSSLGDDTSGNTNDFAMSGSGTSTLDCASNTFAVLNALYRPNGSLTYANGMTTVGGDGGPRFYNATTLGANSGKIYCEAKINNVNAGAAIQLGITANPQENNRSNTEPGANTYSYALRQTDGEIIYNSSGTSYGTSYTTNDIIGIAMDLDNNKLYFSKNGVWMNSANPSGSTGGFSITDVDTISNTNGFYHFAVGDDSGSQGGNNNISFNFGNGFFGTTAVSSAGTGASTPGTFEYDVPTNYQPLTTKGLNV